MTDYSIFTGPGGHTALTPPAASTSFSSPITLGTLFQVTADNLYLKGFSYWVADAAGNHGPQEFALWQSNTGSITFTLVPAATVTSGTPATGAWNTALLPAPIPLVPGSPLLAATGFTGNFNFTSGFWGTGGPGVAGLSNGPLSMYSDATGPGGTAPPPFSNNQGLFSTTGGDPTADPPATANSSFNPWLDLVITDQAPAGASYCFWPNLPRLYPSGSTTTDTTGYTIAMEFSLSEARPLLQIRHYSPPGVTNLPTRCAIWDVTTQLEVPGTDNTSPAWSGAAGSGWVTCDYTSAAVTLQASHNYRVSTFNAAGTTWFAALANYWTAGGLGAAGRSAGPLTAPSNAAATAPGQNSWKVNAWGYPDVSTNPENDWIDVLVGPAAAPSSAVNIAQGRKHIRGLAEPAAFGPAGGTIQKPSR